jgi:hypothetical protein
MKLSAIEVDPALTSRGDWGDELPDLPVSCAPIARSGSISWLR